jgi:hypothetical protein
MTDTTTTEAPAGPEQVTLHCDECSETFTGPAKGRGSAPFKMGAHKYRRHGVAGKAAGTVARGRSAPTVEDVESRPVLGVVRDMAAQIPSGSGPPTEAALTQAGARGLGIVSVFAASLVVESEEGLTDREREEDIDRLSLSQNAASQVVRPLAKLAAPTKLNRKYGRTAVENVDALASVCELLDIGFEYRRYFRRRRMRDVTRRPIDATSTEFRGAPPTIAADVPGPIMQQTPEGPQFTSPPPQAGVVFSREMLEGERALQQRRENGGPPHGGS